jgi:hypothetical protein
MEPVKCTVVLFMSMQYSMKHGIVITGEPCFENLGELIQYRDLASGYVGFIDLPLTFLPPLLSEFLSSLVLLVSPFPNHGTACSKIISKYR